MRIEIALASAGVPSSDGRDLRQPPCEGMGPHPKHPTQGGREGSFKCTLWSLPTLAATKDNMLHWGNLRFGNSLGDHETVRRLRFLTASRTQKQEELPTSLFRQAPLWQAPKETHWLVQLLLSPCTWLVLLLLGLLYLFPPITSLPKLGPEAIVLKAMNSEDMQLAVKNALQRSGAGAMQTEGLIMGADGSDLTKEEAVTRILATFEDVTADSQMFSENLYKAGNYPTYRNARGECVWKERQFSERDFFTYKHYRSVSDWERRKHAKRNSWCQAQQYTFSRAGRNQYRQELPDHGVKMCDVVSSVNKGEKWSIIRLGPHYSFGGRDMHEVWLYDAIPKIRELLGTHSVVWITGFFAGPVMEDGYPLANPPIAINNIRLFESEGFPMRFPNQNAFIQVNADTQYPMDEGGAFPFSADLRSPTGPRRITGGSRRSPTGPRRITSGSRRSPTGPRRITGGSRRSPTGPRRITSRSRRSLDQPLCLSDQLAASSAAYWDAARPGPRITGGSRSSPWTSASLGSAQPHWTPSWQDHPGAAPHSKTPAHPLADRGAAPPDHASPGGSRGAAADHAASLADPRRLTGPRAPLADPRRGHWTARTSTWRIWRGLDRRVPPNESRRSPGYSALFGPILAAPATGPRVTGGSGSPTGYASLVVTAPLDHAASLADHGAAPLDHAASLADHGAAPLDHAASLADHGAAPLDHAASLADHGAAPLDHAASLAHTAQPHPVFESMPASTTAGHWTHWLKVWVKPDEQPGGYEVSSQVTQAVGLHYEVSDIRREGSGNLNFYVEIAIRYSLERPLRPTALIQTSMPFPVVGAADMRRYVEEFSHFIPAHASSVVWYTGTMAYPGKLLHGSAHSSSRWLDSLYIFTGSPEMIGLNQYGYEIDYAGQNSFRPEDHGIELEDVKLRVLASGLQTGAKLRCASTGRIEFYKILEGSEEEVMGIDTKAPYDRAPTTKCFGDWNWIEGEQWTVVAFHKPACGNGCANFKGPGGGKHDIPVHSTFRGFFAHAVVPITHHTIFGAERPEDMLVADKSLDLVTSFQAAYTVSKRFPPRVAHANVVKRTRHSITLSTTYIWYTSRIQLVGGIARTNA
ncbi:hypothetical protein CYMTET_49352 [Cymbomonas tetramitiformis]|uniref:Uncharacterized protein n=1 Tax=Cymbomonas tetramitiformis TaxID=36881 RepID=A0AAE0BSB6_9CHLO|nr:hypothetical protein CYMTET_49352 [Cymbomonas tetramitiformis]KAK3240838.1 hypothetical protein CYMTET_49352 [Cymbomonas tetramitiformis]